MNNEKAIGILIGAVQVANRRGVYELFESKLISEAVEFFGVKPTASTETAKEEVLSPVAGKETTSKTTGTDTIDK